MKHNSLISANGFHTPIAPTTVKSSFLTAIFKPLLLLFLLMIVGSSAVWADDYALNNPIGADGYYIVKWDCANSTWASSNSMQIGETFTFAIDITGNSYLLGIVNSGHTIAFAHYAGDGYEREYTADCFRLKQISGNIYGATYNFKKDKPDWDTQKIWARFWDGNNWDYPGKEIHSPTKYGLFKWATNTGATDPDFTSVQIAADGGMPNAKQRNGYAAPCACEETGGGGGDPEPDPEPISEVTPVIHGDGLPGLNPKNSGNWDSNTIEMLEYGEDHTFYAEFLNVPATSDNSYRFKIDVNEEGDWWSGAMCNSNVSQANSNVEMVTDDDRISFKMPFEGDVYVFYKSDNDNDKKVWIVAVPKEIGAGSGSNARMHTDLIMDGTSWIENGINLVRNNNAAVTYQYVTSYIAPACTSDEMNGTGGKKAPKVRFDIRTSSVLVDKPSDLNLALTTQIRRVIYLWNSGSGASSVKRYVIPSYPNHSSDDGWKVWCNDGDNDISGNLVNGSVTVQIGGNKDVKYFITNSSSCTGPSGSAFKSNTVHTVNSFGGCYVDKSASINNVTFKSDHQVYTRNDAGVYKLGDLAKPIVADNDCRGIFRLADGHGDKTYDVTFTFDGGVITINAVEHADVGPKYTVTLHPNNGGSNIERKNVPEGSTTSAAALNLAEVTYGLGTATWYTNEDCTTPFTSVTGNMDLYAKWGISGNYWLVGDQWMYDTGSSWNNGENPAFTTTDGVATVTFIAPMGRNRFEIIKDNNWGQKINNGNYAAVVNSASPVAISVADGHMEFTLNEMKKVTIIYDGKVSVRAEAYDIHKTGWNIAGNSGLVGQEWNNSACPMDNNGEKILRNINTGNYEFKITPVGSWGIAAVNQFSAANVDKDNSTSNIFRNWTSHLFGSYKDGNEYKLPMNNKKDRNVCIQLTNDMAINGKVDLKIAFDGGKITVNLLPKYTVSFDSKGGSDVASQSVFEGTSASEPSAPTKAGYDFVKWQLSSADYSFSSAVTGNITLDAVWAYKAVSSVALNESAHTTWLGNSDFVLTPTMTPSDLITKTVEWSSNASGVASVVDGTVHAVAAGEARITCTVTDMFDHVRTATCDVTVAACQMTTDYLYSMTVTGYNSYNSSTGSSATLNGLWNESSDNTEPATFRIVKLKLSDNNYIYDDNGTVKMSTNASLATAQWYEIPIGENFSPDWTGSSFALYEFKNVSTGQYMRRSDVSGGGGDWRYYTTVTDNRPEDDTKYQFFYDNTHSTHLVCRANSNSSLQVSYCLHRCNSYMGGDNYNNCPMPNVPCGTFTDPDGNAHTQLHQTVVVDPSYANPNYKASQMNSSYYRMKADATVRANLENALVYGSVITVRLYADAATSVKLQTAAGDDVETINLSADAVREFNYTVGYGSELVGETAFVIKAADNHAGIASIEVSRTHAASPADPALTWDADLSSGVTQSALAGTFQHVASSALSSGAIHYTSSNEAVATVAADGTVTPIMAGNTTITATIEAEGCYAESSDSYNVTLTEPTLAELIDADEGAGITLTHDYAENIVIDKEITINGGGHSIGNLTVEAAGDLTLSGALTVNDFSIYAKAGNSSIHAKSGQVRNAANLTASGNAYFYYTVDPNGHVQYGWYDFTVPFPVDVMTGIKGIQDAELNEDFVNERNYAIMEHLGDKQAAGEYSYKKFRGVMQPNKLYSITLDCSDNYNTIRFQKTNDGALVASESVTLDAHTGIDDNHSNWNGVGNGTLHHANAGVSATTIQVYQSGSNSFIPVNPSEISLAIGTAFMIQEAGSMTFSQANRDLLAPRRAASAQQATAVQIASEGKTFSDQLFIGADELAGQGYTQGVDVAKAGNLGSAKVAQIWVNAYNSKLCAHEAQLINGRAKYALSLYAPADGSYTLTGVNVPDDCTLYLTKNGKVIWNLGYTCDLDLTKGTTTEYGLLLVESPQMSTGVDAIQSDADGAKKIMRNGILYILHNGKVFNAQGAVMK